MLSHVSPAFSKASYTISRLLSWNSLHEDSLQQFLHTNFEKLALRRIHRLDLTTGHTEEGIIEKTCIFIDKEPASCSDRSRAVLGRMVEAFGGKMRLIPLSPAITLIFQQLPEPGSIFDAPSPTTSYKQKGRFSMTSHLDILIKQRVSHPCQQSPPAHSPSRRLKYLT